MSNALIALMAGAAIWCLLIASILALVSLADHSDDDEDGAQAERDVARILEVTGPAPLERPHVRAGSAWGQSS